QIGGVPPQELDYWTNKVLAEFKRKGPAGYWETVLALSEEQKKKGHVDHFLSARVFGHLNRKAEAVEELRNAAAEHDARVSAMEVDPGFANLRDYPAFQKLAAELKL